MSPARRGLAAVLIASFGLRIWLACQGGQFFWPDEGRYLQARAAAADLAQGRWHAALEELFGHAEHTLFRVVGLPIALVEQAVGPNPVLAGCYFGIFSVLAIYLVWAIARRAGAGESEGLWAALLAACANSLFFYSSHLFPYDASLCIMLGALWLALGPWSPHRSWLAGTMAGLGFLTYNGYWLLGGAVLIVHVLLGEGGRARAPARAACAGAGLASPIAALIGLGRLLGHHLVAENIPYTSGVVGDFHIGYQVIAQSLWAAEGALVFLWLAGFAAAFWFRERRRRLRLCWAGAAIVLGGLVLLSDVIPELKVQGRLVRTATIPFLVLGAACGIDGWARKHGKGWAVAIAVAAMGMAAVNFSGPLRQWFPREFRAAAARKAKRLSRSEPGDYRVMNAAFLFTPDQVPRPPLPVTVVWRVHHPEQYPPFLFEGFTKDIRDGFLSRDCSMQLVRLGSLHNLGWLGSRPGMTRFGGYPGRVALRVKFNPAALGRSEPLIVTGETEAGDFLNVVYQDAAHVYFAFDHWGFGGVNSPLIPVDFSREHEIIAGMGSMYPRDYSGSGARRLYLAFDGQVIFDQTADFYPSGAGAVLVGLNLIGGGTALDRFSGAIESVVPVRP